MEKLQGCPLASGLRKLSLPLAAPRRELALGIALAALTGFVSLYLLRSSRGMPPQKSQNLPVHEFDFQGQAGLEERRAAAAKLCTRYPDSILVICERHFSQPDESKAHSKFSLAKGHTVATFCQEARKKWELAPGTQISLYTEDGSPASLDKSILDLAAKHTHEDGFLYMYYLLA